ncbi:hypothetical protein [Halovulum sp. GXIMD14793]
MAALALWGYGRHKQGQGVQKERQRRQEATLKALRQKKESEDEISELDDTSLADRISRGM